MRAIFLLYIVILSSISVDIFRVGAFRTLISLNKKEFAMRRVLLIVLIAAIFGTIVTTVACSDGAVASSDREAVESDVDVVALDVGESVGSSSPATVPSARAPDSIVVSAAATPIEPTATAISVPTNTLVPAPTNTPEAVSKEPYGSAIWIDETFVWPDAAPNHMVFMIRCGVVEKELVVTEYGSYQLPLEPECPQEYLYNLEVKIKEDPQGEFRFAGYSLNNGVHNFYFYRTRPGVIESFNPAESSAWTIEVMRPMPGVEYLPGALVSLHCPPSEWPEVKVPVDEWNVLGRLYFPDYGAEMSFPYSRKTAVCEHPEGMFIIVEAREGFITLYMDGTSNSPVPFYPPQDNPFGLAVGRISNWTSSGEVEARLVFDWRIR